MASDKKAAEPRLYVLDLGIAVPDASLGTGRICVGSLSEPELKPLLLNQPQPDGIEVSAETGKMYWTNMGTPGKKDGLIRCCNLDGTGEVVDIVPRGTINTPKQIIIEPSSKKLYFCDREGMRVWRCNLDGSDLEIIVQTGDETNSEHNADASRWCVGICVSPAKKQFYWTQKGPSKGNQGKILRAGFDIPSGQSATSRDDIECLLDNLPEPIDLELDDDNQELWWTDRGEYPKGNTLNRASVADLKAGATYTIVARHFHEAIGLRIDWKNSQVYLSDIGGAIYVMNTDGTNKRKLYEDENSAFSGLALLSV